MATGVVKLHTRRDVADWVELQARNVESMRNVCRARAVNCTVFEEIVPEYVRSIQAKIDEMRACVQDVTDTPNAAGTRDQRLQWAKLSTCARQIMTHYNAFCASVEGHREDMNKVYSLARTVPAASFDFS